MKKLMGVRLEPELIEQLREVANKEKRTYSNLVQLALSQYVENYNNKNK